MNAERTSQCTSSDFRQIGLLAKPYNLDIFNRSESAKFLNYLVPRSYSLLNDTSQDKAEVATVDQSTLINVSEARIPVLLSRWMQYTMGPSCQKR